MFLNSFVTAAETTAEGTSFDWGAVFAELGNILTSFVTGFGLKIIGALLVLFIGFKVTKIICKCIKKSKGFNKIDHSAGSFLINILNFALRILVVLTVCAILGIPMTSFAAIVASAGLAVGLALQGSLSNFAGGVMILIFRPFSVDDFISADGVSGTVKDISILYTTIVTGDGIRIVVPNGSLSNATVTNYSVEPMRRADIKIGVSYSSDLEKVERILLGLTEGNELIVRDEGKAPVVAPGEYADSSVNVILRVWAKRENYWTVYNGLTKAIKPAFDKEGIEIPFPQMDVHVISTSNTTSAE